MRAFAIRSRIKPPHLGLMSQVVIVLLVIALMGAMAIEPARQLLEQRERLAGMTNDLEEVQTSNGELRQRIERLNDPDFIEQRAREQIGLVRSGEITYVVMPPSRGAKAHKKDKAERHRKPVKQGASRKPAEEDPGFFAGVLNFIGL